MSSHTYWEWPTPESDPNYYTSIALDCIPPGVNHYVKHTRDGRHYVAWESKVFMAKLAIACRGKQPVLADEFSVEILVTLGPKQKGDVDNFPKLILDTLAKAGMFVSMKGKRLSDSHVTSLTVKKQRGEASTTLVEIFRQVLE